MITNKKSPSVFGLAFIGLVIVSLSGFALLAVLVEELAESGWMAVPNFAQTYFSYREA